ncbi:MAG: patatin-like phospholipase family protein [Ignavibacteriaceae bacterium]
MNYNFKIIPFFLLLIAHFSFPQSTRILSIDYKTKILPFGLTEKIPSKKPVVALALSGGGSRGLSQIGVLKAFEEANIPIDVIVGTSMGSVIGGLYSAGYSISEIDSIARNTDWESLLSLKANKDRRQLFVDQKVTEDRAILTLRLNGFKPIIPTSFNDGQGLSNYLSLLTFQAPIHVKKNFDELRIKFRAVATDLVSGDLVVISQGSLSQAMRASSSVSFFLAPVKVDSMILVDGGLVANIPVIAAKKMADYVIAVNTTSSLHNEDELNLPWMVADQIISIPMILLNEEQIKNANVIINPNLKDNLSSDFINADSLIEKGYEAAKLFIKKIKSDLDSISNAKLKEDEFYIKKIISDDVASDSDMPLISKYTGRDSVSSAEILNDIYNLYNTGDFSDINAQITQMEDYSTIKINYKKNPVINDFVLDGITIIPPEVVDSILYPLYNQAYNPEKLCGKLIEILKLYREKGFSLADIQKIEFNKKTGVLYLKFDEGLISKIEIKGNETTNQTVISREFPLKKGEYFRYQLVEQGLTNLQATNLFEDINLSVTKKNDQNIVTIKVLEKISSLLRIGFRIDDENKAQLGLDVRNENLFGSGTELGLILFGGARNRAYILEHKANRIWNTYLTYKLNVYYKFDDVFVYTDDPPPSERNFTRSRKGEYRQIYYGASAAVGTQVGKFGNLILKGEYEFDELKLKQGDLVEPFKTKFVTLKLSTTIDTQNKYPYPTVGLYFNGFYETAQTALGSEVGYSNVGFEYKSYFSWDKFNTISPKIIMGFGDKTLPLTKQYSLGGQANFFGMKEEEFRGRQILLTSIEYRYKLPFDIFFDTYLKFRYDLGSTWNVQEEIRFKDLRHGIGTTLAFDTPVGPAEFSVGRSFLFTKNLPGNPLIYGDVNFYFSIGYYY